MRTQQAQQRPTPIPPSGLFGGTAERQTHSLVTEARYDNAHAARPLPGRRMTLPDLFAVFGVLARQAPVIWRLLDEHGQPQFCGTELTVMEAGDKFLHLRLPTQVCGVAPLTLVATELAFPSLGWLLRYEDDPPITLSPAGPERGSDTIDVGICLWAGTCPEHGGNDESLLFPLPAHG